MLNNLQFIMCFKEFTDETMIISLFTPLMQILFVILFKFPFLLRFLVKFKIRMVGVDMSTALSTGTVMSLSTCVASLALLNDLLPLSPYNENILLEIKLSKFSQTQT